jgi:ferredoxin--NADP+ reductase
MWNVFIYFCVCIAGPGQLKVDYAISREMKNADGGKLYVQDVIAQNAKEIFKKLDGGANIYFCGLKGMMPNILTTFEEVATSQGIVWADKLKELKANHQWHVEVY